MFRLAHISDPHLGPLPPLTWRDLASKRITGYVNWQRHRGKMMGSPILAHLMTDLQSQNIDHLVITGDLVNLGLGEEIEKAGLWLKALGEPHDISVVPGNHDAYVPGALAKACKAWLPFMSGDKSPKNTSVHEMFPYVRVRGKIAIIGVSSAIATSPFLARGAFRSAQAKKLKAILKSCDERGLFRIIMIHHPPVRGATSMHKRLFGIGLFQQTVEANGAELVLHGHTHLPTTNFIDGKGTKVPVIGVSATSQTPGGHMPASGYNLFEISGEKGSWNCELQHRAMTEQSTTALEGSKVKLFGNGKALTG